MSMSVSREDFEVKINEVGKNLYFSHFHLKIHEKMTNERNARLQEYPPFFEWSWMAHYETGVLRLTRAYDKDRNSLGILKILNIIEANYRFWNCSEDLDNQQLEQDKKFLSKDTNNLVNRLLHQRDKLISHTDPRLYPQQPSYKIKEIYEMYGKGEEFILRQDRITTEGIENLPSQERQKILNEMNTKVDQTQMEEDGKILGIKKPSFYELYQLTTKGIEICNRYRVKIGIVPIELKLEGIDEL